MKILSTIIFILAISPAYAEIFKCEENGNTIYQQSPCKQSGEVFVPRTDISLQEQKAALEKLEKEVALQAEKKQQEKQAADKERMLRAQEEQADAAYRNANANRARVLQERELENRNVPLRTQPLYIPNLPIKSVIPTPTPLPEIQPGNE